MVLPEIANSPASLNKSFDALSDIQDSIREWQNQERNSGNAARDHDTLRWQCRRESDLLKKAARRGRERHQARLQAVLSRNLQHLASGLSLLNFRVDGFEFASSVVDFHPPIDTSLRVVHVR